MNFLIKFAEITGYDCGGADILRVLKFVLILLDIVLFIVPIALIIIIMIDFAKNVIAGKEDEMKKNVSIVIKRLMFCVVLFLVPAIVRFTIRFIGSAGVDAMAIADRCIEIAKTEDLSQYEVDYEKLEPSGDNGTNGTGSSGGSSSNNYENKEACYRCTEQVGNIRIETYEWSKVNLEAESTSKKVCFFDSSIDKVSCLAKNTDEFDDGENIAR